MFFKNDFKKSARPDLFILGGKSSNEVIPAEYLSTGCQMNKCCFEAHQQLLTFSRIICDKE